MRRAGLVLSAVLSPLALAAPPTFTPLPSTGPDGYLLALAISGNAQVIAGRQVPNNHERAFVWRRINGEWLPMPLPSEHPLDFGRAIAISYNGDTVAGMTMYYLGGSLISGTPTIWTGVLSGEPALASPLDDDLAHIRRGIFAGLSADGSFALGYTAQGTTTQPTEIWSSTAGVASRFSPAPTTLNYYSSLYGGNPLSADGSVFVGSVDNSTRRIAFRWTAATGFVELATPTTTGRNNSRAETVSRDGLVVGGHLYSGAGYNLSAYPAIWTSAGRTDLPLLPPPTGSDGRVLCLSPDGSLALGVQYSGFILGLDAGQFNTATAVLWIDGQVQSLATYLTSRGVDLQGINPNWITSTADDGRTLVGFGTRPGNIQVSFIATLADCPADLNGDGLIDFADYLEFLNLFDTSDLAADFNHDGLVDFADYLEFLNLFDQAC